MVNMDKILYKLKNGDYTFEEIENLPKVGPAPDCNPEHIIAYDGQRFIGEIVEGTYAMLYYDELSKDDSEDVVSSFLEEHGEPDILLPMAGAIEILPGVCVNAADILQNCISKLIEEGSITIEDVATYMGDREE